MSQTDKTFSLMGLAMGRAYIRGCMGGNQKSIVINGAALLIAHVETRHDPYVGAEMNELLLF